VIVDRRILACVVISIGAHVAFARTMRGLPRRADLTVKRVISIRVVSAPPPAEPPPEPSRPQLPTLAPAPAERVHVRHAPRVVEQPVAADVPPPQHPPAPSAAPGGPVFGISMESTSQAGGGPSLPVGNTASPSAGRAGGGEEGEGADMKGRPVPAYEVTTMPLPEGRCAGKYTEEAKLAAIEGTVVLDLVVGADGRVTDVRVVSGLGHGLTAAAVAAAKACHFSPGQKGDVAVAVRIRDFKIRFLLQTEE
jgi:protein TonB